MSETNNNIPQGGSIAFFATYRPPIPLDIYTSPIPLSPQDEPSPQDEHIVTDGHSYNYNGRPIPPAALKLILKRLRKTPPQSLAAATSQKLAAVTDPDIDSGTVSGLVVVSERTQNLETLHFAILDDGKAIGVINFAELYGVSCGTVRMEDSGCIAGDNLIYVTTKEPDPRRCQPWTAVFKTNLKTGDTKRLTPKGEADLSPAVSPSGKLIAMASYQFKCGWKGEIEDLKTDIFIMNVNHPHRRLRAVADGGWPSWADDDILFFHRRDDKEKWGVYQADVTKSKSIRKPIMPETNVRRVTPKDVDAVTPAAIDSTTVAVAIIRSRDMGFSEVRKEEQYRHIEIFDVDGKKGPIEITRKIKAMADHYNPFFIVDKNGVERIGYHRCRGEQKFDEIQKQSNSLPSPYPEVGLFRVPGVFPTFSNDGTKLAFVDNEFRNVYIADKKGLRKIYEAQGRDGVFNPVWNQSPEMDKLYVCVGPSFHATDEVNICVLSDVSMATKPIRQVDWLTDNGRNNAFPFTNPEGTKLVYRSTKDFAKHENFKNLYIMEDADGGENEEVTRLTEGKWTDTHCQWSPNGKWIVFTSTRDKPGGLESQTKNDVGGLDIGSYAVYLVKPNDKPTDPLPVVIRVVYSGSDLTGHVTHPFFSPDGKYIVLTSDLAGISADPISMPLFLHSVRPYGEIFCVKLKDEDDLTKNKDIMEFTRITHSRYENGIAAWTKFSTQDPEAGWNVILDKPYNPICPVFYAQGGEKWNMTGHLCIPKRCC